MLSSHQKKKMLYNAKKQSITIYLQYFITSTYLLWLIISKEEYSAMAEASFGGWLEEVLTKGISNKMAAVVEVEYCHLSGTIREMQ